MPSETDLPCPDCDVPLDNRTIKANALPGPSSSNERVTVADCPECGARFYPDQTLDRLFSDDGNTNGGEA
jgi:hypothetical protein